MIVGFKDMAPNAVNRTAGGIALTFDAVRTWSLRYTGVSYHRNPEHGGSHGSSAQEASQPKSPGTPTASDWGILSPRPQERHREMAARPCLFALAGGGLRMVAAA